MDLSFNDSPEFTKWIVGSGALQDAFVVVDVGVQGGENPRWHFMGDNLVVHGFDAIEEVIDDLSRKNAAKPNRTYHWYAIGDEDGEREFYFKPSNPTNSSFYSAPDSQLEARAVPVRKLDTLLREGVIPRADFLKVDVEGFERDVFWGARELLAGVLGVESETNFNNSPIYPDTHFGLIQSVVLQHGLFVSDLNFNRVARGAFHEARSRRNLVPFPIEGNGKPATVNVLFCRDLTAERDGSLYYQSLPPPPSVDQILKAMAIYELHGLNDVAVATAVMFSNELGQRVDVERAVDLLCRSVVSPASVGSQTREHVLQLEQKSALLSQILASTSWRLTAPLRTIVDRFRKATR